jgi:hypothetical protein
MAVKEEKEKDKRTTMLSSQLCTSIFFSRTTRQGETRENSSDKKHMIQI